MYTPEFKTYYKHIIKLESNKKQNSYTSIAIKKLLLLRIYRKFWTTNEEYELHFCQSNHVFF